MDVDLMVYKLGVHEEVFCLISLLSPTSNL
jgi:hypothetical protein